MQTIGPAATSARPTTPSSPQSSWSPWSAMRVSLPATPTPSAMLPASSTARPRPATNARGIRAPSGGVPSWPRRRAVTRAAIAPCQRACRPDPYDRLEEPTSYPQKIPRHRGVDESMATNDPSASGMPAYAAPPPPPPPAEAEQTALRALGRLIRRRFIVILVPLLAVPAAAVAITSGQPKKYTAQATLIFADSGKANLASGDPAREAATNIGVLQTGVITDRTLKRIGGTEGKVKFTSDAEANLVKVAATSRSPRRAARIANGVSREYIAFRLRQTKTTLKLERARVDKRISELKQPGGSFSRRKIARSQIKSLTGRSRALTNSIATLTPDVRQIGVARAPSSPSSPHPVRAGIIGFLLGLALGFAIAFALERLDLRVRDPREFETAFGRPILGRIPRSRALAKAPPGRDLPPVEAQAFADLRAKLRYATQTGGGSANGNGNGNGNGDRHPSTVVVTSAEAAEGKTTVAWHLACAAAAPRSKVLVIEADLRRPGLSAKLGTDGTPGLSEVLQGHATLHDAVRQIPIEPRTNGGGKPRLRTVDVLFAGSPATDPTSLLESREMHDVLDHAATEYDLVILDTPPTSVAQDAVPLVTRADGVVVVGRLAKSRLGSIADLNKTLTEVSAHTYGVVVNSTALPRDVYHYYYDRRGRSTSGR